MAARASSSELSLVPRQHERGRDHCQQPGSAATPVFADPVTTDSSFSLVTARRRSPDLAAALTEGLHHSIGAAARPDNGRPAVNQVRDRETRAQRGSVLK